MQNFEKVTLLTIPSTHIRNDLPLTPAPYRQIVGVRVGRGPVVRSDNHESNDNLATYTYSLHSTAVGRLLEYFARHFSDQQPPQQDAGGSRNCFLFGVWMVRGLVLPSSREACEMIYQDARYTPPLTDEDDKPGRLSVIRPLEDLASEPVLHGMVKLDNNDYVQVMTRGGVLGITTADEALSYRCTPIYREQVVRQGFQVDPISWNVGHFSVSSALQPDY